MKSLFKQSIFIGKVKKSFVHTQAGNGMFSGYSAGGANRQLIIGLPLCDLPVDNQVVLIAGKFLREQIKNPLIPLRVGVNVLESLHQSRDVSTGLVGISACIAKDSCNQKD